MKKIALFLVSVLSVAFSLEGQINGLKDDSRLISPNTLFPDSSGFMNSLADKDFLRSYYTFPIDTTNIQNRFRERPYSQRDIRIRHNHDFDIIEELPYHGRHYNDLFCIVPDKRGKLIIIEPDRTNKYYLIIKDPVSQLIHR
jgi:hypothetical protein